MFADDCSVYKSNKIINELKPLFQSSVNEASDWYTNNRLPINVPKSMFMLSAPEHSLNRLNEQEKSINISLNDKPLNQVTDTPYLGITVDSSLKWNVHVMNLCKKVSSKLALLNRLRKFIDKKTLLSIYNSIIQPNIDYAISIWGYSSRSNRELITRLQHRAARIICGNMDFINVRGEDLVKQLGLQSIEIRRNYFTATLMYKIAHEIAPKRLVDSFVYATDTHDRTSRSSSNYTFQVPEPNFEFYRNSPNYQGTILWNSLPSQLKNASDIDSFKSLYKKTYLYYNSGNSSVCMYVCMCVCLSSNSS